MATDADLAPLAQMSAGAALRAPLAALCLAVALPGVADVSLRWQSADDKLSPMLADYLVESNVVSDFVALVSANFRFPTPLVIAVGAASGPDYDVSSNTIRLPLGYLERAVRTQAELVDESSGEEALAMRRAIDVIEYTLYHLLGHALAGNADVAVDRAAESLSSWAMLGHWPGGAAQWLAAIEAFGDASRRLDGPLEDYWHAHALYGARERELRCLIVGREPSLDAAIPPRTRSPERWRAGCRERWTELDAAARRTLAPLLREDAPLARRPTPAATDEGTGAGRAAGEGTRGMAGATDLPRE